MEEERSNCPDCGDKRNRLYTRVVDGNKKVYFCHNCNAKGIISDGTWTPSVALKELQRIMSKKDPTTFFEKKIRLPYDFTLELPLKASLWLQKYSITLDEIKQFRFGWSPKERRLILPVFQDNQLIYYQGRTFEKITKDNPKYLNIRQSGAKNVYFRRNHSDSNTIVVVEDILSAIKVGRYVNSLALLGSYLPPSIIPILRGHNVVFWLDDDKYESAFKFMTKVATRGIKSTTIRTKLDPKEVSNGEMLSRLQSLW